MVWVRAAPRALGIAWAAFLVGGIALVGYAAYLAAAGTAADALRAELQGLRTQVMVGLAALLGVPGLAAAIYVGYFPERAGRLYHEGWLAVKELGDSVSRPGRSRWPYLVTGRAGTIQAKDWLLAARNPFTWLRVAAWSAGVVGLTLGGKALSGLPQPRQDMMLLLLGLGLVLFCSGEVVAALFSSEGPCVMLYVLTGVRPSRVLAGKLLTVLPIAPSSALTLWAGSFSAGHPLADQVRLAPAGGVTALIMAAIVAGAAAASASLHGDWEAPESRMLAAALEQVPRGVGAWAGFGGAAAFGVVSAGLLSGAWKPGLLGPLLLLCLGVVPIAAGYVRLRRLAQ